MVGAAVVGAFVGVLIFCFFAYFLFFLGFSRSGFLLELANKKYKNDRHKNLLFVRSKNFSQKIRPKISGPQSQKQIRTYV